MKVLPQQVSLLLPLAFLNPYLHFPFGSSANSPSDLQSSNEIMTFTASLVTTGWQLMEKRNKGDFEG